LAAFPVWPAIAAHPVPAGSIWCGRRDVNARALWCQNLSLVSVLGVYCAPAPRADVGASDAYTATRLTDNENLPSGGEHRGLPVCRYSGVAVNWGHFVSDLCNGNALVHHRETGFCINPDLCNTSLERPMGASVEIGLAREMAPAKMRIPSQRGNGWLPFAIAATVIRLK
jgi:hypothetical protein